MDYRGQTAETKGIFAEQFWPRDDETIDNDYYRTEDRRITYLRSKVALDGEDSKFDRYDVNENRLSEGRRMR